MTQKPNPPRVWLIHPKHMIWLLLMVAFFGFFWMKGTPHMLFTYRYQGPDAYRYYIWCNYIGWHSRRIWPDDGKCPVIRLLHAKKREGR